MPTYVFRFKDVKFNTADADGEDELTANLLNSKFGRSVIQVDATKEDEALEYAIGRLKWLSGFEVLDADYDVVIT